MSTKRIYITTPLYYVNAAPHIGHSYTTVAADCLARYHRLRGERVFLLTGTDEHGQKVAQAAAAAGETPQAFADRVVAQFTGLWALLGIAYDDFIRTTQARHVEAVQAILSQLHAAGKLTRAAYRGWYCTPDETFWTESELGHAPAAPAPLCPTCERQLEPAEEEGWYLGLRAEQPWLVRFFDAHPGFVRPESRWNEIRSLLEQPLPEYLCITRPRRRVSWGIGVPFSGDHVTYVWFDALLNYITVAGYPQAPARFRELWPADVQLIGKDILRHHAVYWPIMLHALGLPDEALPRRIFAHGWWKIGEQKMSKSLGNIVDPAIVIRQALKGQPHAADIYRYFLLREVPFGQDGHFSETALETRLASDLANDLGNLVNRACAMIERYCGGAIPRVPGDRLDVVDDITLKEAALGLAVRVADAMERLEFSSALEAIFSVVSRANRYIEARAPWKLAKEPEGGARLERILSVLAEVIRLVAVSLDPFMPTVAEAIWRQLGCGDRPRRFQDLARWPGLDERQAIGAHPVLFPKPETGPAA